MSKRWTAVETRYLKKHAGEKSVEELAARFHTDVPTVERKLRELKLDASPSGTDAEAIEAYEKALEDLHGGKHERAAERFEELAAADGHPELAARARQLAIAARRRAAEESPEDDYLLAIYEKNRGNYEEAMAICSAGGRSGKDERYAYLAAAISCLEGDLEKAASQLTKAIELDPRNRAHARTDPDFEVLREEPQLGASLDI